MQQSYRYRIVALSVAAGGVALVAVAIFTGGARTAGAGARPVPDWRRVPDEVRERRRFGPGRPDAPEGRISTRPRNYRCPQCRRRMEWGSAACAHCGWPLSSALHRAALPPPPAGGLAGPQKAKAVVVREKQAAPDAAASRLPPELPSPREQNAAGKAFVEGHWLGLEVISVTPELARAYGLPKDEKGILVDEVTLEAAESGLLAGDLVQSVGGHPTADLKAFFLATLRVREERQTQVGVSRRGEKKTLVVAARNTEEMGTAQMEAAQPIMPGSISPHRSRGRPCTACHVIMRTGGQLPTDAGDILPSPPPIAVDARAPHGNRGRCSTCHVVR